MPWGAALPLLPLLALLQPWAATAAALARTVHTVVPTECAGPYFEWQIISLYYSWKRVGHPGAITRILSCNAEDLPKWRGADLIPTHVVPSLTADRENSDQYSAYNKPGAVMFWLQEVEPEEDYLIVIDADMVFHQPLLPWQMGVKPGWGVAGLFTYMDGVVNDLALRHIPWVAPRNDTLAGPFGRRGDEVGGFCSMLKSDMRRVAPLWLKYTRDVRNDPEAWRLSNDAYVKGPGDRPWISEMYGYSFASAAANVWHTVAAGAMLYPAYETREKPSVLHYGVEWGVGHTGHRFDKHWFTQFDPFACPPWDLAPEHPREGLMPHPPSVSTFNSKGGWPTLVDLYSAQPVLNINAALCAHHRGRCPPSPQLEEQCAKADALLQEMDDAFERAYADLAAGTFCLDTHAQCREWAAGGECRTNPSYMQGICPRACGQCPPGKDEAAAPAPPRSPAPANGSVAEGDERGEEGASSAWRAAADLLAAAQPADGREPPLGAREGQGDARAANATVAVNGGGQARRPPGVRSPSGTPVPSSGGEVRSAARLVEQGGAGDAERGEAQGSGREASALRGGSSRAAGVHAPQRQQPPGTTPATPGKRAAGGEQEGVGEDASSRGASDAEASPALAGAGGRRSAAGQAALQEGADGEAARRQAEVSQLQTQQRPALVLQATPRPAAPLRTAQLLLGSSQAFQLGAGAGLDRPQQGPSLVLGAARLLHRLGWAGLGLWLLTVLGFLLVLPLRRWQHAQRGGPGPRRRHSLRV